MTICQIITFPKIENNDMPANILNMPAYTVTAVAENEHDYHINAEVVATKEALEKVKAARDAGKENMQQKNDAEFYFVVVCRDDAERGECMKRLGVPRHEQFVSADALLGVVGE